GVRNGGIVVMGDYGGGAVSGGPCGAKARPFRPRRSYFAPAKTSARRALVEAPGTAPGSDRFIATAIYRHSRVTPAKGNISAESYRRKSGRIAQKLSSQRGRGRFGVVVGKGPGKLPYRHEMGNYISE